ncbi:putative hypothetical protein [Streptomyces sp. NBRC 110611]|uniref:hypothetical protein n=1 Tax=Streptomyces sp. NBRC 110611 TaxID=1621259 RepID=UPI00082BDD7A|nr:hypothetical protein [Streptomyces sp. NBRC 110611]GAU68425.1 putative hypothetical protein [Streptomyces sp. NBRC 110611]
MRSPRLLTGAARSAALAGTALSAVVLGLTTTTASAGDFGDIGTSPDPARPGATVSLSTTDCGNSRSASIDASTVGGGTLSFTRGSDKGPLAAWLKLRPDTEPGTYGVGGTCDNGKEIAGTVHIGAATGTTGPATGTGTGTGNSNGHRATGSSTPPRAGMTAGAGSGTGENTSTTEIAAGTGALLAAFAGGIWWVRRRRTRGEV